MNRDDIGSITIEGGRITMRYQDSMGSVTEVVHDHVTGITDKDWELAARIEESVLWKPRGGALEGTPNKWVRGGDPN